MATTTTTVKERLFEVIFGYDSRAGKLFDIILICLIVASVLAVMLDSITTIHDRHRLLLYRLEWLFTLIFTVEYGLRIYSSPRPKSYIFSFYGIIDLLSILPTYISLLLPPATYLVVVRILRVLRIFRILKLFRYIGEANLLLAALLNARRKIFIFLFTVLTLMIIFGTLIFIIEGPENGFTSIPVSIYWSIVTVTTVGYGDVVPQTGLGQAIAALAMICGYAIIAIPTGIVGVELMHEFNRQGTREQATRCPACDRPGHRADASFCQYCGVRLDAKKPEAGDS
ncbi:MAG: ion transporter [Pseudohongiellaceae bacterium]